MLDATNQAVSSLVAHALYNQNTQREMQLELSRVLANQPHGINIAQKQLALLELLEQLVKMHPVDFQASNLNAIITTLLLGTRPLTAALATDIGMQEDA